MDYKKAYEEAQERLADMEQQQRRESDEDYQRREEERRERKQASLEAQCYADSWRDAFNKGISRMQREANDEADMVGKFPASELDFFFTQQVEQHRYAFTAWEQEMAAAEPRIQRIRERAERLIQMLEQQARNQAAERTDTHFNSETAIGQNLRDDDFRSLVEW